MGGFALGLGMAFVGLIIISVPGLVGLLVVLTLFAVAAMFSSRAKELLPQRSAQVRYEDRLRMNPLAASFKWGVQLGAGVATRVITPAFYVMLAIGCLLGGWVAVTIGVLYGTTRCTIILAVGARKAYLESVGDAECRVDGNVLPRLRLPLLGGALAGGAVVMLLGFSMVSVS